MAAQHDAELVRSGYEAFGKGDIPAVRALMHDEIAWHVPGRSSLAGDYHGPDEVLGLFGKLQEGSEGSFRLDIHDLIASDEHVVVLVTATGHRGDKTLDVPAVHVWHIRDGRATEFWSAESDPYAVDEFWA